MKATRTSDLAAELVTAEQTVYSARWLRFVRVALHQEEYLTAYLAPDPRTSQALLERLRREFVTLPPRHDCSCRCPQEQHGWPACSECKRLRAQSVRQDMGVVIGRTQPINPPLPFVLMLDLERALAVLGKDAASGDVARFLSEGAARCF